MMKIKLRRNKIIKLSEVKLFKKKCKSCKEVYVVTGFHKDVSCEYGLKKKCKICKSVEDKKRYKEQYGIYIYIIEVDNTPWYVGSTTNMPHRISNHINNEENGHFMYMCKTRGIDLSNKKIDVLVCNTQDIGYNLTKEDIRYYEHKLIRMFKKNNYPLLNTIENSEYIERERYIDEIPLDGFKFVLSKYNSKRINSNKHKAIVFTF